MLHLDAFLSWVEPASRPRFPWECVMREIGKLEGTCYFQSPSRLSGPAGRRVLVVIAWTLIVQSLDVRSVSLTPSLPFSPPFLFQFFLLLAWLHLQDHLFCYYRSWGCTLPFDSFFSYCSPSGFLIGLCFSECYSSFDPGGKAVISVMFLVGLPSCLLSVVRWRRGGWFPVRVRG